MSPLASPIGKLKSHYDVVVVGSGYGGAIAASRLARVKRGDFPLSVCVLERGQEFQPGDFPCTPFAALRQLQVDFPRFRLGSRDRLYDFRINGDVSALVGCGLGGTSLINANVMMRPLNEVFEDARWPRELQQDNTGMEAGYQRALEMLAPSSYPTQRGRAGQPVVPIPRKLEVLQSTGGVDLPLLTISFESKVNHVGAQQRPCTLCGDCVSGCNHSAKNTVAMNYLPDARNHGAELYCGAEVRWLEKGEEGKWLVWLRPVVKRRCISDAVEETFISASIVILGAGTLGSTEILHRSREKGLVLSGRLGTGFTGNGDVIAFGYNNDMPVNGIGFGPRPPESRPPVGPTIIGTIDERESTGLLVQEGAIPGALAPVLRWFAPLLARVAGSDTDASVGDFLREIGRELWTVVRGGRHGALRNTQTYLVMTHENGAGVMHRVNDRLRISWPGVGFQDVFRRVQERLRRLTERSGGRHVVNPLWTRLFGKRLLTVHPLGGCCMSDDASGGVVNHRGQVFAGTSGSAVHGGLYVCDGSVIPRSLGTNPLWTIAAIAERTSALIAGDLAKKGLSTESFAGRESRPPRELPPRMGIRFAERMSGSLQLGARSAADSSPLEVRLIIESTDLTVLLNNPEHPASIIGVALAPALSVRPLSVTGKFSLFVTDDERVETSLMRYRLKLAATDGRRFFLDGVKTIDGRTPVTRMWDAICTLEYRLYEGEDSGRRRIGQGTIRISAWASVRMVLGATITHANGLRQQLGGRLRFALYYAGVVFRAVAWPLRRAVVIDPFARRAAAELRIARTRGGEEVEPEPFPVTTSDGAAMELTRYRGGNKGPVILAPGFGTSTLLFRLPLIERNIVEYLAGEGYEVWLLDYRASDRSVSSRSQFNLDDIARYDIPRAVSYVIENTQTGRPDVQYIGHCVASVAAMMSLLDGRVKGIRSAIFSQFFIMVEMPLVNRVKSALRIAEVLDKGGFAPVLNPDFDRYSARAFWVADRLLHFYPSRERCRSPVCRRTLFLFGENYQHRLLNRSTHDAVYDMFDRANLTTFKHLTRMVRARRAVSADGKDIYVDPNKAKSLELPITLLQGARNGLFLPHGATRTLEWLREHGGFDSRATRERAYRLVTLPEYGHMDTFIGRNVAKEVFPVILRELERGDDLSRSLKREEHLKAVNGRVLQPA